MAKNEKKIEEMDEQIMSPELEAMKAQIAKMLAEAKAEAEAIVNNAKEKAQAVASGKRVMTDEEQKTEDYWNEEVEIQLFKDSGKYRDDQYVAINGTYCIMQRGKPIKVKRKYAEALRLSLEQDNETADMIRELTDGYAERADKLN